MNVNLFAKFRCFINNLGKENRQTKKWRMEMDFCYRYRLLLNIDFCY